MSKVTILVVENDASEALDVKRTLESADYHVNVSKEEQLFENLSKFKPDLVLMNIELNREINGIKTSEIIKKHNKVPLIFLTTHSEEIKLKTDKLTDYYSCLRKPFDTNELKRSIEMTVYNCEMEKKLRENFENLFENAPIGIFHSSPEGKLCRVNKALVDMYGYDSTNELINDVNKTNIGEKLYVDQEKRNVFVGEVLEDVNWHSYKNRYYRKDGTIMTGMLSFRAVKDENGSVKYLEGFVMDITEQIEAEEALRNSESRYRLISENTGDVIWIMDINSERFTYVSPSVYHLRGYTSEEVMNQPIKDVMTRKSFEYITNNLPYRIQLYLSGDESVKVMTSIVDQIHKNGKVIPTEVVTTLLLNPEGRVNEVLGVSRDITERKKMEESLVESEEKYRTLFEADPDYTILLDSDGIIVDVNLATIKITGLSRNEIIGRRLEDMEMILKRDLKQYLNKLPEITQGQIIKPFEARLIDKEGNMRWVSVHVSTIEKDDSISFILIIASDITASKKFEKKLQDSLREKEVLLQEIHHRVKNNMQIISSLLNIQTRYVGDKESINVLKESQNRVKSMAIIHEKLYRSQDFNKIYFADYIESLAWDLFYSYSIDKGKINLDLEIDDVKLNIETSVPCGLIITELVSNCLKYAFPGDRKGELKISLKAIGEFYELIISDNGVGFPADINFKKTDSLGLQLVNSLTDQIDGQIELDRSNGTEFRIKFKELVYKERM